MQKILNNVKIPKKFYRISSDNMLCYTIGIVNDGGVKLVVYKVWIPWKRHWDYRVIDAWFLYQELYYKQNGEFPD